MRQRSVSVPLYSDASAAGAATVHALSGVARSFCWHALALVMHIFEKVPVPDNSFTSPLRALNRSPLLPHILLTRGHGVAAGRGTKFASLLGLKAVDADICSVGEIFTLGTCAVLETVMPVPVGLRTSPVRAINPDHVPPG